VKSWHVFPSDAGLTLDRDVVLAAAKYDWLIMGDHVETVLDGLGTPPVSDATRERWVRLGAVIDLLDEFLDETPTQERDWVVHRCVTLLAGGTPEDDSETLPHAAIELLRAAYAELGVDAWNRLAAAGKRIAIAGRQKAAITFAANYRAVIREESDDTVELFLTAMTLEEKAHGVGERLSRAFRRLTRGAVLFDHARDLTEDLAVERAAITRVRWTRLTLYAASAREFAAILRWPRVFHALMSPWPDKLRSLWYLVTTRSIIYGDDAWDRWTADPHGGRPVTVDQPATPSRRGENRP
jgi:hypothetical protein